MSIGQGLFLAFILSWFIAGTLTVVVQIKMWTTRISWLVPIILVFYVCGIGALVALAFRALAGV
jgi:hypothetical protein